MIPVPFGAPDGDITIFIGDWYTKDYKVRFIHVRIEPETFNLFALGCTDLTGKQELRKILDEGNELGVPDGVLFNGLGPFRYNESVVPDGIVYATINVEPGKHLCSLCPPSKTLIKITLLSRNTALLLLDDASSVTPSNVI